MQRFFNSIWRKALLIEAVMFHFLDFLPFETFISRMALYLFEMQCLHLCNSQNKNKQTVTYPNQRANRLVISVYLKRVVENRMNIFSGLSIYHKNKRRQHLLQRKFIFIFLFSNNNYIMSMMAVMSGILIQSPFLFSVCSFCNPTMMNNDLQHDCLF